MKRIITVIVITLILITTKANAFAYERVDLYGQYRIEVLTGIVINENLDGKLIYDTEYEIVPGYDYISYYGVEAKPGDLIQTVLILNGYNDEPDDILVRLDYVIDTKGERK